MQSIVSKHTIVAEDRLTTFKFITARLFLVCNTGCDRVEAGESKPGVAVRGVTVPACDTINDSRVITTPASHSLSEPEGKTGNIPDAETLSVSYLTPQIST